MLNGIRRAALVSASVTLLALLLAVISAPGAGAAEEKDRYIVVFEDWVEQPGNLARTQVEQRHGKLGFVYRHGLKGYSAFLSDSAADALRNDPRVRAVRPDHPVVPAAQSTPTGVNRIFTTANEALAINEEDDVRADVDVAVLDTGIDYEHPDLDVVDRTYCNGTFESASCTDGTGTDEVGHGTHVAGTIAALDNGEGVVGVAPGARLWSVKVLDPGGWESELTAGVEWVTEHASEIEVANMSIGCSSLPCSLPTMGEAINASAEAGVVYVVAAGNNGGSANNSTFGTNPSVITVSALADFDGKPEGEAGSTECRKSYESKWGAHGDDSLAAFSNRGSAVEVVAPGVCIRSTVPGGNYAEMGWWGTSMASPHVAGAAALLAARDNPENKEDVEVIGETIFGDSSCPTGIGEGNCNWTDTSGDGIQEPLLDVGDESIFTLAGWSIQPSSKTPGFLEEVSCISATDCTAVGYSGQWAIAQHWNGSEWTEQVVEKPLGATSTTLNGVSCTSSSVCFAVGHYVNASSNRVPLAEKFNDFSSKWEVQDTESPSGTPALLEDVSCAGASECVAVGWYGSSSVSTLIERWDGTEKKWKIQTGENPSASHNQLTSVSCPSATFCMAAGFYRSSSNAWLPLTESWSGGEKWIQHTAKEPAGATHSWFFGVSCTSSTECTAVGDQQFNGQTVTEQTLAERWNDSEKTWTVQKTPNPESGALDIADVSCTTSSVCTMIGSYWDAGAIERPMAIAWDGETGWAMQYPPMPTGDKKAHPYAVSCVVSQGCEAVGFHMTATGEILTFSWGYRP